MISIYIFSMASVQISIGIRPARLASIQTGMPSIASVQIGIGVRPARLASIQIGRRPARLATIQIGIKPRVAAIQTDGKLERL